MDEIVSFTHYFPKRGGLQAKDFELQEVWRVLRAACCVTRVSTGSLASEEKQRYRERAHDTGTRPHNCSHAATVKA